MWVWLLISLVFAGGYFLGWWQNKRWRYQRIIIARLRFQAIALSVETLSLRNKVVSQGSCNIQPAKRKLVRKRPTIAFWKRRLIAWLRLKWPWLTKFMRFSPMTYINWQKAKARSKHHDKILAGKAKAAGRPATPQFIVDAILAIKQDNLRYTAGHIGRMISGGELKFRISKKTVAKILKDNGFKPKPKGKRPPREEEPGWVETIYNQHCMAIDTKKIYDLAGNALYIFNIIDHDYAKTTFSSQGLTAENVIYHAQSTSTNLINQRDFYVATSRATDSVQVVTDNKRELTDLVKQSSGEKQTAQDIAKTTSQLETTKDSGKDQQMVR